MAEEPQRQDRRLSVDSGDYLIQNDGIILHVHGPTRDGIRTSGPGWTAAADIDAETMSGASATGIPSHNEDLTLETCRVLVRRLNQDGATWGEPQELPGHTGQGVDVKAPDPRSPDCWLQMQVIRAETSGEFWESLARMKRSDLPSSTTTEAARRIWTAIERKRLHAYHDVVLVLNAMRTPWLALPSITAVFPHVHGQDVRGIGFKAVWIVGASEAFVARLDS
jgi:hypothetical protein